MPLRKFFCAKDFAQIAAVLSILFWPRLAGNRHFDGWLRRINRLHSEYYFCLVLISFTIWPAVSTFCFGMADKIEHLDNAIPRGLSLKFFRHSFGLNPKRIAAERFLNCFLNERNIVHGWQPHERTRTLRANHWRGITDSRTLSA